MTSNQNINGVLCYVFGWITGLIFLLTEKQNQFVRFHAAQSLVTFGVLFCLSFFLGTIGYLLTLIFWIFLMYQVYQGKQYKLPVIGDIAEQLAKTGMIEQSPNTSGTTNQSDTTQTPVKPQ